MKNIMVIIVLFAIVFLSSCTRPEDIRIIGENNGNPIFCFSSNGKCLEKGLQLTSITILEVDSAGHSFQQVWSIQGRSNNPSDYKISCLEYGKIPTGWVEYVPPKIIKEGILYSINDRFLFKKEDGVYSIYNRSAPSKINYFHPKISK